MNNNNSDKKVDDKKVIEAEVVDNDFKVDSRDITFAAVGSAVGYGIAFLVNELL